MGWGGGGHAGRATQLGGGGGRSSGSRDRWGAVWAIGPVGPKPFDPVCYLTGEATLRPWCGVWSELCTQRQVTLKISMINETTWSSYEVSLGPKSLQVRKSR